MQETKPRTDRTRIGERTEPAHSSKRFGILDYTVLMFVAFTLMLMPIFAGGQQAGQTRSEGNSFSTEEQAALAESRGDAAASAAAENAAGNLSGSEPIVGGASKQPVDNETKEAIDEASRGDAAARGSVSSDYGESGRSN